jgi:riboflavin synthase
MFTGLVQALAEVCDIVEAGAGQEVVIACGEWAADLNIGESVAINGCCLTVVSIDPPSPCPLPPGGGRGEKPLPLPKGSRGEGTPPPLAMASPPAMPARARFQVGPETLSKTNLGQLKVHDRVNVERALAVGDRLGGHIVQGHIDGTGRIIERHEEADWVFMGFAAAPDLLHQMVPKGSVAVDGVSLTIVEVQPDRFSVALIPHTLANTTLGLKSTGATVNLETDILAKYVARHLNVSNLSR